MSSLRYIVVEFEKESSGGQTTLEVVPETWRDTEGNRCFLYPNNYSSDRVLRAARKGEPPTDTWQSFPVRKEWLTTESWEKANRRCNKLIETSNPSDSDEDLLQSPPKRARKVPLRFLTPMSDNSGSDGDVPKDIATSSRKPNSEKPPTCSLDASYLPTPPSSKNLGGISLIARPPHSLTPVEEPLYAGSSSKSPTTRPPVSSNTPSCSSQNTNLTPARFSTTQGSNIANQNTAISTRMLSLYERITERLDRHEALLRGIAERQQVVVHLQDDSEAEDVVLPTLPISSQIDLRELNHLLGESRAAKKKMLRSLSLVGGSSRSAVVRNILKELFSPGLCREYNVTGVKGKQSLKALKALHEVIIGSIRTHKDHKNATDKEIEMIAGKWFTDSRDRQGERNSRKKQTQAGQANQVVVVENEEIVHEEIEEQEEMEEN